MHFPAHDPNTNAIIGVAYDAFDPDVICEEFNRLKSQAAVADADEEVDEDPKVKPANLLARGKHYTMFSFQNWSGKHK